MCLKVDVGCMLSRIGDAIHKIVPMTVEDGALSIMIFSIEKPLMLTSLIYKWSVEVACI